MKNRLLSILLCAAMVLGLVPVSVLADSTGTNEHTHCVCGKSGCGDESHGGDRTWTGISSLGDIKGAGNYYLTKDVTLDYRWEISSENGEINLCLNGKTITWTGYNASPSAVIYITGGGNLTVTDCRKYTGGITTNKDGVIIYNLGTFTLWNGKIYGNQAGCGVQNCPDGTFNMYGGSIENNHTTTEGGGVVNDGTFNMTGGSITGNSGKRCGGVYNRKIFNMTGGSITDNSGKENSGGVYNIGTLNISGTPIITDNTVDGAKNNVYLRSDNKKITVVGDGMSEDARVGITGTLGNTVITGTSSTTGFFVDNADNTGYDLVADGNGGIKLDGHKDHRICGDSDCTEHGNVLTWKGITNLSEITKSGNYYLKQDVTLTASWSVDYDINLCLNGKTITGPSVYQTITITKGSLTITDCTKAGKITHAANQTGRAIYNATELTIWNGIITGNDAGKATDHYYYGGGVYNNSAGTFNMYGGSIIGNYAQSGGGVYNAGTFNMYGGTISDNTSESGGGVHNEGKFTVSGAPNITGNMAGSRGTDGTLINGVRNNVYNHSNNYYINSKGLDSGASVGISGSNNGIAVKGTTSLTGFFCDDTDYMLKDNGNNGLKLSRDVVLSGKLLTKADGAEMTAGKKTYDANAVVFDGAEVKINGNIVEDATFAYTWQKKDEDGTYTALTDLTGFTGPTDAGDYKFTVTAIKGGEELASTTWTFTVEKARLNVTVTVSDKVYDGKTETRNYSVSVTGFIGNGTWDWRAWDANFEDANVGNDKTVTVKFEISGDTLKNHTAPETVEGKANITPRTLTVNVTAQNKEYDGTADANVKAELDKSGVVNNDEVTLVTDGVTAKFDTKNAGKNKTVTLSGSYGLSGTAANNYTLSVSENLTANINKRELTVKNLIVANKIYDGTNKAEISGTPTLSGALNGEDVTLKNGTPSFAGVSTGENIPVNFTEFSLSGADAGNYTLVQPTGITANITPYTSNKSEYRVNSNDWLNDDFTVTAENGWLLSYTNTAEGEWVDRLTASQETDSSELRFYVKNKASGIISEVVTEYYKIDKTAPAGEIRINERNWWQEFLNTISFNLFYPDKQTVSITASDNGSGVKTIEYLLTADDLSIAQLADKTFTAYEKSFGLEPDAKLIVYVKITDTAGNVKYLRSDFIVLDATAPVISGADNGKTYCGSVRLTVTDEYLGTVTVNGDTVELTDGKLTLNPANGVQTVVATDKAGNSTTVKVTINDGHTWGEWTSKHDGTHTRVCEFDGASDTADCHGGTATCQEKAICDDCHQPYGDYGAHDWDMTDWGYTDADGHARICKTDKCAEHSTVTAHTKDRDAATENDPVKCTECGYEIASALGHICANHLMPVAANEPTCTEDGNKAYYKCDCGKFYEDATANIEITDHSGVIKNKLGHDWAEATCTAPKTCKRDGCNATDGNLLGHNYSDEWSKDASGHWHECQRKGCTDKADFTQHAPGADATETDDQTCTECGYVITPALGHVCANHLTPVEAKDATCTETGNIAYYKCDCSKLFKDATASVEITEAQTVIANKGHEYEWIVDKEATATEKGIKHEECKVCHDKKAAVEIPDSGGISHETGDSSMTGIWLAILIVSGIGVAVTVYSKKKRSVR